MGGASHFLETDAIPLYAPGAVLEGSPFPSLKKNKLNTQNPQSEGDVCPLLEQLSRAGAGGVFPGVWVIDCLKPMGHSGPTWYNLEWWG